MRTVVDAWKEMMHALSDRIKDIMDRDHLHEPMDKGNPHPVHEPFMKRYGYRDGRGWWIKETD